VPNEVDRFCGFSAVGRISSLAKMRVEGQMNDSFKKTTMINPYLIRIAL